MFCQATSIHSQLSNKMMIFYSAEKKGEYLWGSLKYIFCGSFLKTVFSFFGLAEQLGGTGVRSNNDHCTLCFSVSWSFSLFERGGVFRKYFLQYFLQIFPNSVV